MEDTEFRGKTIARLMDMVNARDREIAKLKAAPAQPEVQGEVRKARCISMRPGMGEVTLRMDNERVPGFMDPGHEVFVLEAHPEPASPAQSEVQRLREALEYFVSVMPKHGWPTDYDGWRRVEIAADKSRIALAASTGQEVGK